MERLAWTLCRGPVLRFVGDCVLCQKRRSSSDINVERREQRIVAIRYMTMSLIVERLRNIVLNYRWMKEKADEWWSAGVNKLSRTSSSLQARG